MRRRFRQLRWAAALVVVAMTMTSACAADVGGGTASGAADGPADVNKATTQSSSPAPPAPLGQAGRQGPTQQERYVPARIVLPGGASAPIVTASTVDGQLRVPERVADVGWWDGGAEIGDPFGSIVIAGHIDSINQGLGFFARLPSLRVGEKVTTRGPKGEKVVFQIYRIDVVRKAALATNSAAFGQSGDSRLVLITCTGHFDRANGGYDSNLVVLAKPV